MIKCYRNFVAISQKNVALLSFYCKKTFLQYSKCSHSSLIFFEHVHKSQGVARRFITLLLCKEEQETFLLR